MKELTDKEIGKAYERGFKRKVKANTLTEEIERKRFEGAISVAQAQLAKVLQHRDRPDKEKIVKLLKAYNSEYGGLVEQKPFDAEEQYADQIQALFPDEEEIGKEGFAKGIKHYREVILPVMVEEAKREERERIINWLRGIRIREKVSGRFHQATILEALGKNLIP